MVFAGVGSGLSLAGMREVLPQGRAETVRVLGTETASGAPG